MVLSREMQVVLFLETVNYKLIRYNINTCQLDLSLELSLQESTVGLFRKENVIQTEKKTDKIIQMKTS